MRNFDPENSVDFNICNDIEIVESYVNEVCYADLEYALESYRSKDYNLYIELTNIECTNTIKYHVFYCDYIGKILKLDYTITKDSFKFKDTYNEGFNLLVCTLIRYLWEGMILKNHIKLFEGLFNSELKYSLEEFCNVYKTLSDNYMDNGHTIGKPSKINIKNYEQLNDYFIIQGNSNINKFFYNE